MSYLDEEPRNGRSFGAVIGGYAVSRLLGAAMWLPVLLAVLCQWLIRKARPQAAEPLRWAAALTLGQCLWMLLGGIIVPGLMPNVLPDIVLGIAVSLWLIVSLARLPLVLLLLLQLGGLAVNVWAAANLGVWGPAMGALIGHMALRCGVIGFGAYALATSGLRIEVPDEEAADVFA